MHKPDDDSPALGARCARLLALADDNLLLPPSLSALTGDIGLLASSSTRLGHGGLSSDTDAHVRGMPATSGWPTLLVYQVCLESQAVRGDVSSCQLIMPRQFLSRAPLVHDLVVERTAARTCL